MLSIFLLIWLSFMLIQLFMLKKNKHVHFSDFFLLRIYLVLNYCFSLILIFPFLNLITLLTAQQPLYVVCATYFMCILVFNLLYFLVYSTNFVLPCKAFFAFIYMDFLSAFHYFFMLNHALCFYENIASIKACIAKIQLV